MLDRLSETYVPGDEVQIRFGDDGEWHSAIVERHAFPGMWVRTRDRRSWFVTNARRVRQSSASNTRNE